MSGAGRRAGGRGRLLVLALATVLVAAACNAPPGEGPTTTSPPGPVDAVGRLDAGGGAHVCVVRDGRVLCWGRNLSGELGIGESGGYRATPTAVLDIHTATAVTTGAHHTCALLADATVRCWGRNISGQLGPGAQLPWSSFTPVAVPLEGVLSVSASNDHTCALLQAGTVRCWGLNERGAVGSPDIGSVAPDPVAVQMETGSGPTELTGAVELSSGGLHNCVRFSEGRVSCWGSDSNGQLGSGINGYSSTALPTAGDLDAASLSAGQRHTCATTTQGAVYCWGRGSDGRLGNGSTSDARQPVAIPGLDDVVSIDAGDTHSCAVRGSGGLVCWGSDTHGELGQGDPGAVQLLPVAVPGLSDVSTVAVSSSNELYSGERTCAMRAQEQVWCWGSHDFGALGVDPVDVYRPVPIAGIGRAAEVSAGSGQVCVILVDGRTVSCWGTAADRSEVPADQPEVVVGLSGVQELAVGKDHRCALVLDGRVLCWGSNDRGQLGIGQVGGYLDAPTEVPGLGDVVDIAANEGFSCAMLADGTARCWGANEFGQIGNGIDSPVEPSPVAVDGIVTGVRVSAGQHGACAAMDDGSARCWGRNNSGQLGRTTPWTTWRVPVVVTGAESTVDVSSGSKRNCTLRSDVRVTCWGFEAVPGGPNVSGSATDLGRTGVERLAVGQDHACVVVAGGQVQCWGDLPEFLSSGAGLSVVPGPTDVVELSSGVASTCSVSDLGEVWCWGSHRQGQLAQNPGWRPLQIPLPG